MINSFDSFEGKQDALEVLGEFYSNPEKITRDKFIELSDWEEERNEELGYRLKTRQGVIGGCTDAEGDDVVIVGSFSRMYPLQIDGRISASSLAHANHKIQEGVDCIVQKYSQKYENIIVSPLPTPSWMHEL